MDRALVDRIVGSDQRTVHGKVAGGAVHATVHDRVAAADRPYAELKSRVFEEVIRRPPFAGEMKAWMAYLFGRADVRYDDMWYSPRR